MMFSTPKALYISTHLRISTQEAFIMARITVSIPKWLKERLDKRPDVNWPEVMKEGMRKRLEALQRMRARGEL